MQFPFAALAPSSIPFSALAPSLITGGASLLGQGLNAGLQNRANQINRQFALDMYNRQRQDALSDFDRVNAYNTPAAQMQRFREAGLNPNLIYGQANMSAPIRSNNAPDFKHVAPQYDLGETARTGLMAFNDTRVKGAQFDNLTEQNNLLKLEGVAKAIENNEKVIKLERESIGRDTDKFKLGQLQRLADISYEAAKAGVEKTLASTTVMLDANERQKIMLAPNLATAIERIAVMKASKLKMYEEIPAIRERVKLMKQSGELNQFEINLNKKGFTKGDPYYFRVANKVADNLLPNISNDFPELKDSTITKKLVGQFFNRLER